MARARSLVSGVMSRGRNEHFLFLLRGGFAIGFPARVQRFGQGLFHHFQEFLDVGLRATELLVLQLQFDLVHAQIVGQPLDVFGRKGFRRPGPCFQAKADESRLPTSNSPIPRSAG